MTLSMEVTAKAGPARAGTIRTARGEISTPCFMPVGTKGAVRHLSSADLSDLGVQIVLGNTYHLMLKPGAEVIRAHGGLHGFTDWAGHVLTDSGGYQIFSLEPGGNVRLDDDGVTFRSTYDGGTHRLTPESAVEIQTAFGSDFQMVLDVCAPLPSEAAVLRSAVDRTAVWARRAAPGVPSSRSAPDLNQLGIVQGGTDLALRAESADRTLEVGFDGYAIGGLSVGESREAMLETLAAIVPLLPEDQPRYLMGLGDPLGMVEAVALGIDLFDCVLPTRFARHGTILSAAGRYNLKRAENTARRRPARRGMRLPGLRPLVPGLPPAPAGGRRADRPPPDHAPQPVVDVRLVDEIRAAVEAGSLDGVRSRIAAAYG